MTQDKTALASVTLIPLQEEDFQSWLDNCTEEYAKDQQKARGGTIETSRDFAKSSMANYLGDGLNTKGNHFFHAIDSHGKKVGSLWFAEQTSFDQRAAFLYDILIFEGERGKGFGRATMKAFEKEVAKMGISKINLHVFAFNKRALGLYQSLGFEITDYSMSKHI